MSDSYYGGGGGGFMAGGTGSSQGTPGGRGGGSRDQASLRPVTVKQVLNATQPHPEATDFTIDDHEISSLTLVGLVRKINPQATNVTITVDDTTGEIDGRLWLDSQNDEDNGKMEGIEVDVYVRIVGQIKSFGGKRHVSISQIYPIVDRTEVFYHMAEAQYVHLVMTKGALPSEGAIGHGSASDYASGAGAGGSTNNNNYSNLPVIQQEIMRVVSHDTPDDGVNVLVVAKKLTQYNPGTVLEAIEVLISEGQLYTTIDDEHVHPT